MKSNVCEINKNLKDYSKILNEVEKVSEYNKLEKKQALRLRLIAEELTGMLRGLVDEFEGKFWVENNNSNYEFHVEIKVEEMSIEKREEIISVSKEGKNIASTGIMGKIRAATELIMLAISEPYAVFPITESYDGYNVILGFDNYIDPIASSGRGYKWSLCNYKENIQKKDNDIACDELERSIIANIADDIIVGVKGKNVEIIIKKTF